ncbi:MAG: hypothetical protein JJ934_15640 [Pseudomonadales bacterium]|nr:hypothetical protein [Pseudomonadales bacterium]
MSHHLRLVLILGIALLCCSVALISIHYGFADHQSDIGFRTKRQSQGTFDESRWRATFDRYQVASDFSPSHPLYHQELARLYVMYLNRGFSTLELSKAELENLTKWHFRRAIELRPRWPATIAEFVFFKFRVGEFDEEFREMYRRALEVGPNNEIVLFNLSVVGVQRYSDSREEVREAIETVLFNGLISREDGVMQRSARLLGQNSLLRQVVALQGIQYLIESDWSYRDRRLYLWLANWLWDFATSEEQNHMVSKMMPAANEQPMWVLRRLLRNQRLKSELCMHLEGNAFCETQS